MKDPLILDILKGNSSFTASKWISERIPFIFGEDLYSYIEWKEKFSRLIDVDSN